MLTIGLPLLALGLHEITHLAAARSTSHISVSLVSYVPLRLRLDFCQTPSPAKLRVIALAPAIVGCIMAIIAIQSGLWRQLQAISPYYVSYLAVINWLLYIFPSPTDIRLAIWPSTEDAHAVQMNPQ